MYKTARQDGGGSFLRPAYGMSEAHRAQDELQRPPCGREIEYNVETVNSSVEACSAAIKLADFT